MSANRLIEREEFLQNFNKNPQFSQSYIIELSQSASNYIEVPDSIVLCDQNQINHIRKNSSQDIEQILSDNKLKLFFNFKSAIKDFRFNILIKNKSLTDVRIYRVML